MCPHWIAGILVPGILGYAWAAEMGAVIASVVAVVIPYVIVTFMRGVRDARDFDFCEDCIILFRGQSSDTQASAINSISGNLNKCQDFVCHVRKRFQNIGKLKSCMAVQFW